MKNLHKLTLLLLIGSSLLTACEDDDSIQQAASLRIVHAVPGAPAVHVNYFGVDNLDFSVNPTLSYGTENRYTLPAGEARNVIFTYSEDTTRQVFSQEITLEAGAMGTFFLTGDSANLAGFMLTNEFQNYADSIFGASFIHASADIEPVSVRSIALDTAGIADTLLLASDVTFQAQTPFFEFDASSKVGDHTFQFLDATGAVLGNIKVPQFAFQSMPLFKNITICLIGDEDSPEVIRIDNF